MAESGRGALGGLAHLARARRQGQRAAGAGQRNETLAMIHESHVLLALGRPDEAAARARAGAERAHELGLVDHGLVLTGNLGEALAAAGELEEARQELERAAEGWAALGRGTPSPADPGLAWLLYAEGRIDEALMHYRSLARVAAEGAVFEQITPVATGHALAASTAGAEAEAQARAGERDARVGRHGRPPRVDPAPGRGRGGGRHDAGGAGHAARWRRWRPTARPSPRRSTPWPRAGSPSGAACPTAARACARPRPASTAMGMRWWGARALFVAGSMRRAHRAGGRRPAHRAPDLPGDGRRRLAAPRGGAPAGDRAAHPHPVVASRSPRARACPPARSRCWSSSSLGLRNRDIGARLFISERTVARHLVQIYAKLGVPNRTSAVRAAHERGLIAT